MVLGLLEMGIDKRAALVLSVKDKKISMKRKKGEDVTSIRDNVILGAGFKAEYCLKVGKMRIGKLNKLARMRDSEV